MVVIDGLLSGPEDDKDRVHQIGEVWNKIRSLDDPGQTTWETIEALERDVTECLVRRPPDIAKAASVTFKTLLLIAGQHDL